MTATVFHCAALARLWKVCARWKFIEKDARPLAERSHKNPRDEVSPSRNDGGPLARVGGMPGADGPRALQVLWMSLEPVFVLSNVANHIPFETQFNQVDVMWRELVGLALQVRPALRATEDPRFHDRLLGCWRALHDLRTQVKDFEEFRLVLHRAEVEANTAPLAELSVWTAEVRMRKQS